MKANNAFKNSEDAVSPVIGVILMVAITVVLAAVVFVLVSDLGDGAEKAPDMSFSANDSDGAITLIRADTGLSWDDDFTVSVGTCTTNGFTGATVSPGQAVSGCSTGDTVSVVHDATNTLVYTHTF